MFINAPRRSSNGTTTVNRANFARTGGSVGYTTPGAAAAVALNFDSSASPIGGQTQRNLMQKGIVGPNKFIDTDYAAYYRQYKAEGHVVIVYRNTGSGLYHSQAFPLGYGYTGFHSSGLADNLFVTLPWNGGTGVTDILNRAIIANLRNRISTEASVKALGTKVDMGEALTGLLPSVRMVSERVIQVLKAWNAVRSRNFRRAANVLGLRRKWLDSPADAANVWLEMQYGWLPLLSDIFNGSNEIIDLLDNSNDSKDFFVVTRRGREGLLLPPAPNTTVWTDIRQSSDAYVTVETKLRYVIGDSFVAYMSQLRLNNPLYIAWTAVPYSFVLDWLFPVGDMLSALGTPIGLKFRGGYTTTRTYAKLSMTGSRRPPNIGYPLVMRSGSASAETSMVSIQRTGLSTFPGPRPYLRLPIRSFERAASAVSLIESTRKHR